MTHGRTAGRGTNAPSEAGEPSVDRAGPAYRPADTSARRRCHLLHRPPSAGSGSAPSRRCGETEELAGESVMVDYLFIYLFGLVFGPADTEAPHCLAHSCPIMRHAGVDAIPGVYFRRWGVGESRNSQSGDVHDCCFLRWSTATAPQPLTRLWTFLLGGE